MGTGLEGIIAIAVKLGGFAILSLGLIVILLRRRSFFPPEPVEEGRPPKFKSALCPACFEEGAGRYCSACGKLLQAPRSALTAILDHRLEDRALEDLGADGAEGALAAYREALAPLAEECLILRGRESSLGFFNMMVIVAFLRADGLSPDEIKGRLAALHAALDGSIDALSATSAPAFQLHAYFVFEDGCSEAGSSAVKGLRKAMRADNRKREKERRGKLGSSTIVYSIDALSGDIVGRSPELTREEIREALDQLEPVEGATTSRSARLDRAASAALDGNEVTGFLRRQMRLMYDTTVLARHIARGRVGVGEALAFFGGGAALTGLLKKAEDWVNDGVSLVPDILGLVEDQQVLSMIALMGPLSTLALIIHGALRLFGAGSGPLRQTWTCVVLGAFVFAPFSLLVSMAGYRAYHDDGLAILFIPAAVGIFAFIYLGPLLARVRRAPKGRTLAALGLVFALVLAPVILFAEALGLPPLELEPQVQAPKAAPAPGAPAPAPGAPAPVAPGPGDVFVQNAIELLQTGQARGAIGELRTALTRGLGQARESDVQRLIGLAAESLGETEPSMTAFRRAVELAPEDVEAWLGLGRAATRLGKRAAARAAFQEAEKRSSHEDTRALANLGLLQVEEGDLEGGLAQIDQAIRIAPDQQIPRLCRSLALIRARRFDEALAALSEAEARGFKDGAGLRARIRKAQGD